MTFIKNEFGYWEVRVKGPDGKFKSISTKKKDKREALQMIRDARLKDLERAAEMGLLTNNVVAALMVGKRMDVQGAVVPWGESMKKRYMSEHTVYAGMDHVNRWIKGMDIASRALMSITVDDIDPWINPLANDLKASTRGLRLSHLKSFFKFCCDSGWVIGNPANLVQVNWDILLHEQKETTVKEAFTETEVGMLLDASRSEQIKSSIFWNAAIAIGYGTGLRISDICRLEWDCLADDGSLTVWTVKRDKRVKPPYLRPDWIQEALVRVEKGTSRFMFPRQQEIASGMTSRGMLVNQFRKICDLAWIGGKSFHSLRVSYSTEMFKRGVPLEHISTYLGHSNPWTTKGYIR